MPSSAGAAATPASPASAARSAADLNSPARGAGVVLREQAPGSPAPAAQSGGSATPGAVGLGVDEAVPSALAALLHQSDRKGRQNAAPGAPAPFAPMQPMQLQPAPAPAAVASRHAAGAALSAPPAAGGGGLWGSLLCCASPSAIPVDADAGTSVAAPAHFAAAERGDHAASGAGMDAKGAGAGPGAGAGARAAPAPARGAVLSASTQAGAPSSASSSSAGGGVSPVSSASSASAGSSLSPPSSSSSAAAPSAPAAGGSDGSSTPSRVLSPTSLSARASYDLAYAKQAVPAWGSQHPAVVHANMLAHSRGAAAVAAHHAALKTAGELPRSPVPARRPRPPTDRINNVRRPASAQGEGPLLAPLLECDAGKPCLVLDLDETLVHSVFKPVPNPDYVLPVEIEGVVHYVYVCKRPGCDIFLEQLGRLFEVVVFTVSAGEGGARGGSARECKAGARKGGVCAAAE